MGVTIINSGGLCPLWKWICHSAQNVWKTTLNNSSLFAKLNRCYSHIPPTGLSTPRFKFGQNSQTNDTNRWTVLQHDRMSYLWSLESLAFANLYVVGQFPLNRPCAISPHFINPCRTTLFRHPRISHQRSSRKWFALQLKSRAINFDKYIAAASTIQQSAPNYKQQIWIFPTGSIWIIL